MDLDFESAIRAGERNLEAKHLIVNWCRHARVQKFGGVGLIEAQTGLPIGLHSMACDFAPAATMATWWLEEAALQFHDANCVGCSHRVSVDLPNLSQLVARRDADRKLQEERTRRDQIAKQEALQARAAARAELRVSLPLLAKTFMDDLDRLDQDRNGEAETRLIESARLAPEILVRELAEYLFSALEGDEHWLDRAALTILEHWQDQARLVRCAMKCLSQGRTLELAAAIVTHRIENIEAPDVLGAAFGLGYIASPPRWEFDWHARDDGDPGPLLGVAARYPEALQKGLILELDLRDASRVGVACRAMGLLMANDAVWIRAFTRPLAGHLSRLDRLLDFERDSEVSDLAGDIQIALSHAFLKAPDFADDELMRQFESASEDGEGRLAGVYERVLREASRDESPDRAIDPSITSALRVAIRRLASWAVDSDNSGVSQHVLGALQGGRWVPEVAAKAEMDVLLGAALLLDTKLQVPDQRPSVLTPPNPLEAMERHGRRARLMHHRDALLEVAIRGALADEEGLACLEGLLAQRGTLTESSEAALIRKVGPLLNNSSGLRAMLPYLYNVMVSGEVAGRAAAADALREIGSRRFAELPSLVGEGLMLMILDPYVMVHQAAVSALARIRLPEEFHLRVTDALDVLIATYRGGNDPRFLLECIDARVTKYLRDGELPAVDGQMLLALIGELDPSLLLNGGHRFMLKRLQHLHGWSALILRWVGQAKEDYQLRHALELAADIPVGASAPHVSAILEAVQANPRNFQLCSTFVELLTRDRAWNGAAKVAATHVAAFHDTVRERPRLLNAQQLERRVCLELMISEGRLTDALALGQSWKSAGDELNKLLENDEKFPHL